MTETQTPTPPRVVLHRPGNLPDVIDQIYEYLRQIAERLAAIEATRKP